MAWRDPAAFLVLDALIEFGLADVPQERIHPAQIRAALKIYVQKKKSENHGLAAGYRFYGTMGSVRTTYTRVIKISHERRQEIARRAVNIRWQRQREALSA
jgi:hypothetical protein